MNAHDFSTPIKAAALEKLSDVLPAGFTGIQFYSDGSSAVEAAIRAARAATGRHEFVSCFRDFHGKSMAAVSCAQMVRGDVLSYGPTRIARRLSQRTVPSTPTGTSTSTDSSFRKRR